MSKIAITDYFSEPEAVEKTILGDLVGMEVGLDTEVLLVWHQRIDEAYVSELPRLRGIQRYGVGYDNLDLKYLKGKQIVCCNNPDYGVWEVSDTALAMILNISRGVGRYNHLSKKLGPTWQENVDGSIRRTSELTVGVVGAGRIGGRVLQKSKQLGFKTAFYDPYKERGYEKLLEAERYDTLEELLAVTNIVSLHAPLNQETQGMVDSRFMSMMAPGAALVNTARGRLSPNLDLLYDGLISGHLSDVALDVLPHEPPVDCRLLQAWRDPEHELQGRITINPHTSYFSTESALELRRNAAMNALNIYRGQSIHNLL